MRNMPNQIGISLAVITPVTRSTIQPERARNTPTAHENRSSESQLWKFSKFRIRLVCNCGIKSKNGKCRLFELETLICLSVATSGDAVCSNLLCWIFGCFFFHVNFFVVFFECFVNFC